MLRIVSALLALMIGGTAFAQSAGETSQRPQASGMIGLAYNIAFWSIPFGATSYEARFANGGYAASSHFETSGIVSLFWQAIIDASASGRVAGASLIPNKYDSFYRRGSTKKERVTVTFDKSGVTTFADPPYDTTKYPVSGAEKREAVDPMSAVTLVLTGIRAEHTNPCGTAAPVFDGRRRYDIEFAYVRDEPVNLGALYNGTAHLCRLHYKQIAGFKPKILKEGAAFPAIYGDFAEIPAAGAPERRYLVPLKLWARVNWGTVSAQITKLDIPKT
ncbi:MAG TPA: DUF3108 domain-containing protein [Rhizomicrobium sp.]|jgi:hypothetical protein|nr:DUF3108 domain-containing protein [Rhizomicrobium sp.]